MIQATPASSRSKCALTQYQANEVRSRFGTPCYVYDAGLLKGAAEDCLALPMPFGVTVRYAMKANSNHGLLSLFRQLGLHIDASSDYEVERALRCGFQPSSILLTSQMPSRTLAGHVERGIAFNACSLHQLEEFCRIAPGREVSIRINPGAGSGGTKRTTTGGPDSSFGIWHDALDQVEEITQRAGSKIVRLHTHIGSGADPETWELIAEQTLLLASKFPEVRIVNLGGGFKVGRMPDEESVDLARVGQRLRSQFETFSTQHDGRAIHLEIEPGSYLVANAGYLVATCVDVVDTGRGAGGRVFAKLDAGMTEILRPSLYGAQHPISVLAQGRDDADIVFVGPCCEAGDILTTVNKKPDELQPRRVPAPRIGDLVVIGGAGAYCASLAAINYNSYPQAPEVMLEEGGTFRLLRRRQDPEQVWANEV